ncbi:MAG: META domain-containing protein [Actinobacteria bacterium]|nr:META domain-containing protein [Actinomycetota bacterium]
MSSRPKGTIAAMAVATFASLATLGVAGCSDDLVVPAAGGAPTAAELDGTTWLSTEVAGQTLATDSRVTLAFSDSALAIVGGCNTQTGGYTIADGRLVVEALASTLMACEEDLTAQDVWLAQLVQSEPTISRDGDALTVAGDEVTLVFVDRESSSGGVLDGGTWLLDELESSSGTLVAPDGSHVAFDGESVFVATGCNNGFGSAESDGDTVTIGVIALTLRACEPDLASWEQALATFLTGPLDYAIDGENLTLTNGEQTLRAHFIP